MSEATRGGGVPRAGGVPGLGGRAGSGAAVGTGGVAAASGTPRAPRTPGAPGTSRPSGVGGPPAAIRLRGVTRRFGDHVVLDGLELDLAPGRATALMGPNGSGKTTVTRLLLGLDEPDEGVVEGLDHRPRSAVFQEDRLCPQLSAVDNVRLVLGRGVGTGDVLAALAAVGLSGDAVRSPVRELSGGQRRRVAIVRAVLAEADLVVLDEPFTGLDQAVKPVTMAWVRDRCAGRTVLLVTHDEREAEWFDARVVHLGGPAATLPGNED